MVNFDQKAIDTILYAFLETLSRFDTGELDPDHALSRLLSRSPSHRKLQELFLPSFDSDTLINETYRRDLYSIIVELNNKKNLGEYDTHELTEELYDRGVTQFTDDHREMEAIYQLHLCGESEEVARKALEFIRKTIGHTL